MGVDFIGYSRVRSEPLPERWLQAVKKVRVTRKEREQLEADLRAAPPDVRSLILCMKGASYGPDGRLIVPETVGIPSDLLDEFYKTVGAETDFIHVSWDTGTIWRSTPATVKRDCYRSYSGYSEFCQALRYLNRGPMPYMPPATDSAPENGLITAERCSTCLQGLERVRHHFVAPEWTPGTDDTSSRHTDSRFFRQFYETVAAGADGGVLVVC